MSFFLYNTLFNMMTNLNIRIIIIILNNFSLGSELSLAMSQVKRETLERILLHRRQARLVNILHLGPRVKRENLGNEVRLLQRVSSSWFFFLFFLIGLILFKIRFGFLYVHKCTNGNKHSNLLIVT